ncbi:MAG TPA: hypothetical protein VN808_18285 [Stellaceae bacterium]|nr:hypothetical protein [Stellaceae bacterium]
MNDDVEKLFSWLQTPEIRYREFAGAREVTDAVSTAQTRTNTPEVEIPAPHNVQLDADQFPDQSEVEVKVEPAVRAPAAPIAAPAPAPPIPEPPPAAAATPAGEQTSRPLDSVFNRLSGGRADDRDPRERSRRIPGLGPTGGRPR